MGNAFKGGEKGRKLSVRGRRDYPGYDGIRGGRTVLCGMVPASVQAGGSGGMAVYGGAESGGAMEADKRSHSAFHAGVWLGE